MRTAPDSFLHLLVLPIPLLIQSLSDNGWQEDKQSRMSERVSESVIQAKTYMQWWCAGQDVHFQFSASNRKKRENRVTTSIERGRDTINVRVRSDLLEFIFGNSFLFHESRDIIQLALTLLHIVHKQIISFLDGVDVRVLTAVVIMHGLKKCHVFLS